jgi:hypothetical protein
MAYGQFELSLPSALLQQLPPFLETIPASSLVLPELVAVDEDAQGAYLLFLGGDLVYVGKSDAEAGLRQRLERHYYRVQHRRGLDASQVTFKAARIYSFSVMDVESILIEHYRSRIGGASWNNSGFGSNDPGQKRDTQRPSRFDTWFPLDTSRPLNFSPDEVSGEQSVLAFLATVKSRAPFVLRFEDTNDELLNARIAPSPAIPTDASIDRVMAEVVRALPAGWQGTVLRGYCILYKEQKVYEASLAQYRS